MVTHGHSDVVPETKGCRKKQKMQWVKRQLRHNHIPNDIVVQILLRLPAKSLVRLRWACKYWFNLITRDHEFINMHLHCSTTHDELFSINGISVLCTKPTYYNVCVGLVEIFQCYLNYRYEVGLVPNEVSIVLPNEHCRPLVSFNKDYKILGSCNGLILLEGPQGLCIWNPCTREYKILPHPLNVDGKWWRTASYGFGYDQTTDDYKVIRTTQSQVQVYTLGTNAWRWIGPNPYTSSSSFTTMFIMNIIILSKGVFVNGALYCMDYLHGNIISFDIGKEKFQHVSKLPNVIDHGENWHNVKLHVFEGSLCMVLKIKEEQDYSAEMWVLKDYTVNDNSNNNNNNNNEFLWANLVTIPNLCDGLFPIKPLRYIRNGEILMLNNHKELFLYDPKKNKTRTLCSISPYYVVKEVYEESLVCLNSGEFWKFYN